MIRTPPGWGLHILGQTMNPVSRDTTWHTESARPPAVRRIGLDDLGIALRRGWEDFASSRADVIFLCLLYPIAGLLLARMALGHGLLPLVFPLASGFALIGPFFGVGLNEISRQRDRRGHASWADAFSVARSPSFGGILLLGVVLMMMFVFWMTLSEVVYNATLGPNAPASVGSFLHDVTQTPAGWLMAIVGIGTGFAFALVAFTISVVSFPMLLDRPVSIETAVLTSVRVVRENPVTMMAWAGIIALLLVLGSLPALLGLVIVLPVLGHATWHLYRRVVRD
jgi:uncharacterized membrane protein